MANIEAAIRAVEEARRKKDYGTMQGLADELLRELGSAFWKEKGRVLYELHMGAWQRYRDDSNHPSAELDRSLRLAYESRDAASRGNDTVGALHADMNVSGHILPALDLLESALVLSITTLRAASQCAEAASDEESCHRAERIVMNCLFHQVRIHIRKDSGKIVVRDLYHWIETDPIFRKEKAAGKTWFDADFKAIKQYLGE